MINSQEASSEIFVHSLSTIFDMTSSYGPPPSDSIPTITLCRYDFPCHYQIFVDIMANNRVSGDPKEILEHLTKGNWGKLNADDIFVYAETAQKAHFIMDMAEYLFKNDINVRRRGHPQSHIISYEEDNAAAIAMVTNSARPYPTDPMRITHGTSDSSHYRIGDRDTNPTLYFHSSEDLEYKDDRDLLTVAQKRELDNV